MATRGVFETLGSLADSLHQRFGLNLWPWWVLFITSNILDVIDIASRLMFWPLFLAVPGLSHVVHLVLNGIIAFLGALLWGAPGLLQTLDMVLGVIPGFGFFFDVLPVLSIAGLIARPRWRENQQKATQEVTTNAIIERRFSMAWFGLIGGLVGGIILWLFGTITFKWSLLVTVAGLLLGIILGALRHVEISRRAFQITAGGLLGISLFNLGAAFYVDKLATHEDYRLRAWEELVREEALAVKTAVQADRLAERVGELGLKEKSKSALKAFREYLGKGYKGGALGPLFKKEEGKKTQPPAEMPSSSEEPLSEEIAKLKLGPALSALYRSDYVLGRAAEIRERHLSRYMWTGFSSLGLLAFLGVVWTMQKSGPSPSVVTSNSEPDPNVEALTLGLNPFRRLCPFCKKEVDLRADRCNNKRCNREFPLSVEKVLEFVVCTSCGKGWELDDWMADHQLPFLFQTELGVKLNCFTSPVVADQVFREYFGGWMQGDEVPLKFVNAEKALRFIQHFLCINCAGQSWKLSPVRGLAQKAGPAIGRGTVVAGVVAGGWCWKVLQGAFREIETLRKGGGRR